MIPARGLILLDRDGVLNEMVIDPEHGTVDSPLHPDQVKICVGVPEALIKLQKQGYSFAIVTNQPASAKGTTTRENLEAVHNKILAAVQSQGAVILNSQICFHQSKDHCSCRKPSPGMLNEVFKLYPQFSREEAWMVGDGITDVEAGKAAKVKTVYLGPQKCDARKILEDRELEPRFWCKNLKEFAEKITESENKETPMNQTNQSKWNDTFSGQFLRESIQLIEQMDVAPIEAMARDLAAVREGGGRLFILGVGGSAGHASHAVNDFRKICAFEAYCPTDNVSELTARTNDEGWDTTFSEWLKGSRINSKDCVLVFSVGGGNQAKNVSVNLVRALELCGKVGAQVFGIVGKDGGFTKQVAKSCVVIPTVSPDRITPHTEGFCAVVWHLLVSHPALKARPTKWESVSGTV